VDSSDAPAARDARAVARQAMQMARWLREFAEEHPEPDVHDRVPGIRQKPLRWPLAWGDVRKHWWPVVCTKRFLKGWIRVRHFYSWTLWGIPDHQHHILDLLITAHERSLKYKCKKDVKVVAGGAPEHIEGWKESQIVSLNQDLPMIEQDWKCSKHQKQMFWHVLTK
jgi:hypothetical protein